ncbi:MAG: class I SAM-dependent methyltransferase [bacterium]|nr:class I SAM-dependent methyltransferase [bacterium]
MTLGKYTTQTKAKYLKTEPALNDEELVMVFNKGKKKIVNQIMQRWEWPYMRELAKYVTSKGGDILEVGFGMGISAGFIQESNKIDVHTVIECHPKMIAHAKNKFKNAVKKGRLIISEGFWEDQAKKMPDKSFDGILFDSCPLDKEVEFFQFFPFFKEAYRLLKDDGIFTYFSDEPHGLSEQHLHELKKAGFKNIKFETCKVEPPADCIYWKHATITVPIVRKF